MVSVFILVKVKFLVVSWAGGKEVDPQCTQGLGEGRAGLQGRGAGAVFSSLKKDKLKTGHRTQKKGCHSNKSWGPGTSSHPFRTTAVEGQDLGTVG